MSTHPDRATLTPQARREPESFETAPDVWRELEREAKECQRTWGMGFPVISLHLLKPYLRRLIAADRRARVTTEV